MGVSKIDYFGDTLIDLTADTVTEDTLPEGVTAHNAEGDLITGNMVVKGVAIGPDEPTDPNILIWIDTREDEV